MTNPTLERAARAAYFVYGYRPLWDDAGPNTNKLLCEEIARAVLMAVRDSGLTIYKVPATVDGAYADIVTIRGDGISTMIDAILADGGE